MGNNNLHKKQPEKFKAMLYYKNRNAIPSLLNELFNQEMDYNRESQRARRSNSNKISETDEGYTITLIAAGIDKKELKIELKNGTLEIASNGKAENKERTYTHIEFTTPKLQESFKIDESKIDTENISAELKNGILQIKLIKKEPEYKKQTINIK